MHLIQLHNIAVNHAGTTIFSDLNWAVGSRDRVGLVGPNGAGKSSLLRVIAGEDTPERGTIARMGGVTVGYLAQDIALPEGTLWDAATVPSPELADAHPFLLVRAGMLDEATNRRESAVYHGRFTAVAQRLGRVGVDGLEVTR